LRETDAGAAIGQELVTMEETAAEEIQELGEEIQYAPNESVKTALADRMAQLEEQVRKVQADKAMLEMDRARDVLAYQKRLDEVAKAARESSQSVITSGVSVNRAQGSRYGPVMSFLLEVLEILGGGDKRAEED